jgi:lipid-binding SYLF domain-containing protein
MSLFKVWAASALLAIVSTPSVRAEHGSERLQEAAAVLSEIMEAPDQGIPQDLLEKAQCVVIIPAAKKAAFFFGGSYGRGFVVCH